MSGTKGALVSLLRRSITIATPVGADATDDVASLL